MESEEIKDILIRVKVEFDEAKYRLALLNKSIADLEAENTKLAASTGKYSEKLKQNAFQITSLKKEASDLSIQLKKVDQANRQASTSTSQLSTAQQQTSQVTNQAAKGMKNMSGHSRQASFVLMQLGYGVEDVNYGFRGVANNLSVLGVAFTNLMSTEKGVRGAFKSLGKTLMGPGGILLAFQVLLSLGIALENWYKKRGSEAKRLIDDNRKVAESIDQQVSLLQKQIELAELRGESAEEERKALKAQLQTRIQLNKSTLAGLKLQAEEEKKVSFFEALKFTLNGLIALLLNIPRLFLKVQGSVNQFVGGIITKVENSVSGLREGIKTIVTGLLDMMIKFTTFINNLPGIGGMATVQLKGLEAVREKLDGWNGSIGEGFTKVGENLISADEKLKQFQNSLLDTSKFRKVSDETANGIKKAEEAILDAELAFERFGNKAVEVAKKIGDINYEGKFLDLTKKIAKLEERIQKATGKKENNPFKVIEAKYEKERTLEQALFDEKIKNLGKLKEETDKKLDEEYNKLIEAGADEVEAKKLIARKKHQVEVDYLAAISQTDEQHKEYKQSSEEAEEAEKVYRRQLAEETAVDYINSIRQQNDVEKAESELEAFESYREQLRTELDAVGASEEQKKRFEEETANYKKQLDRNVLNAKLDNATNLLNTVTSLAGEGTAVSKAAGVASATIDTYQAANNALAETPGPPPIPQIAAGLAIATGIKNVKKILSTKVPGGKDKGGSVSTPTSVARPNFNILGSTGTNQLADVIATKTSKPLKAYVVASEVTTQQALDRQTEDEATF